MFETLEKGMELGNQFNVLSLTYLGCFFRMKTGIKKFIILESNPISVGF